MSDHKPNHYDPSEEPTGVYSGPGSKTDPEDGSTGIYDPYTTYDESSDAADYSDVGESFSDEYARAVSEFDRRMAQLGAIEWEGESADSSKARGRKLLQRLKNGSASIRAKTKDRPETSEPQEVLPASANTADTAPAPQLPEGMTERDYMPIRFRRDSRLGCLGGLMYATFVISLSVILACVAWMAASDVLALNKEERTAEVTVPASVFSEKTVEITDEDGNVTDTETVKSADMDAVSRLLKDYGIINYKWLFRLYSSFSHADEKIDPGTYLLSTSYDYRALVKKMQVGSGSQVQTKVTFPEGFTMQQIFERLEENNVCSVEELYAAAAESEYSYSFLEGISAGDAQRLEGFLFPDTYYFFEGMQASSALNKFLSNFHYRITSDMWSATAARGMTFKEVVTVASLIEKEAANDNERYLIASVIYNRLSKDMPLQIDAAVLYGEGNPGIAMPTGTMLRNEENPYNTYVFKGLTPGPICNPGMASIRAALTPADTQYLFYALNEETGVHEFFIYNEEFQSFLATQSYHVTE